MLYEVITFYDSISPIVDAETVDMSVVFRASRWDRSIDGIESNVATGYHAIEFLVITSYSIHYTKLYEVHQLGDPQAGGVEHFQHGAVAQSLRVIRIGGLEQRLHLRFGQGLSYNFV